MRWVLMGCWIVGCAPAASFRPASAPGANGGREALAGVSATSPRPHVDEPWRATAHGAATGTLSEQVELTLRIAFDDSGTAAGVALRWLAVQDERVAVGVEVELGWAWVGLAVPIAVELGGGHAAYVTPRVFNYGHRLALALPAGVSVAASDRVDVRLEGQLSVAGLDPAHRRFHLGAAAAYSDP